MGHDNRAQGTIWYDNSNENMMQLELKVSSDNYTNLLIEELFKYLDYSSLDLSNHESLEKMGKIFSRLKTQKTRNIAFDIISKLDEKQFEIVYAQMNNSSAAVLSRLPFISPYLKKEEDLVKAFNSLGKTVSKYMLMSKHKWRFYKFSNWTLKSKLSHDVLLKLTALNRLKVLRVLAETKEYPLKERIEKKDLQVMLFPLVFEYKQGIENFIEHWKW